MIPASYAVRNIAKRKVTSALTILGIGLVVFVFAGSRMLLDGLNATLGGTGSDENVTVVRKAAATEVMSIIMYDQASIISASPEIALDEDGSPMFANEIYVLLTLPNRKTGADANVVVRGVSEKSMELRPQVQLVEGRMWTDPGSEIIAGKSVAERFQGGALGETVRFGAREWTVVGVFDAGGSAFDSEIWCDIHQTSDAFRRQIYSSLTFRMKDTSEFAAMQERLENDPRLPVMLQRETEYYANQSRTISLFMGITGNVISVIFSLGAIIGAMITMYSSVATRIREIGALRSLGFGRLSILSSFLFESIVISFCGGVIGVAAAYFLKFLRISTTNWDTFSEIAFNFDITWITAVAALIFSLVMGVVGGFLPAVRASRLKIVDALRGK